LSQTSENRTNTTHAPRSGDCVRRIPHHRPLVRSARPSAPQPVQALAGGMRCPRYN